MAAGHLAGRRAVVTGAAAGIGRAIAQALAGEGATLILIDRDEAGLAETRTLVTGHGGEAEIRALDLAEAAQVTACAEGVLSSGPVHILVNCAGVTGPQGSLLESDEGAWASVLAINLTAPYLLMRRFGQAMAERGEGGHIVNITSSSAHRASRSIAAYGASKAGLAQLTRSAAADLGPYGINVNAVAPGLTATRMVASAFDEPSLAAALREGPLANLLGRVTLPDDIAQTVLFLCLPASRQITGQTIHVSAGAIV